MYDEEKGIVVKLNKGDAAILAETFPRGENVDGISEPFSGSSSPSNDLCSFSAGTDEDGVGKLEGGQRLLSASFLSVTG